MSKVEIHSRFLLSPLAQAVQIIEILYVHGKDCPLCFSTCYGPKASEHATVCTRCRGFGRVLDLNEDQFIRPEHYLLAIYHSFEADCPR